MRKREVKFEGNMREGSLESMILTWHLEVWANRETSTKNSKKRLERRIYITENSKRKEAVANHDYSCSFRIWHIPIMLSEPLLCVCIYSNNSFFSHLSIMTVILKYGSLKETKKGKKLYLLFTLQWGTHFVVLRNPNTIK